MKRKIGLLVLSLILGLAGLAQADDKGGGGRGGLSLPCLSKYVSRGLTAIDDPVLQPGATLTYKDFRLNIWGNYNLTNKIGKKDKFAEVDLTAEHTFKWGDFSCPAGVIHYLFPNVTQPIITELKLPRYCGRLKRDRTVTREVFHGRSSAELQSGVQASRQYVWSRKVA